MSDAEDEVRSLPEVIETEQVVEVLEESQFLDLAATCTCTMETCAGEEEVVVVSSSSAAAPDGSGEEERRLLAGQKRKREDVESEGVRFSFPLPTAVVPPSPRQVIATPLPPLPAPHHSPQSTQVNPHTPSLPAVNIQLTSDELQALIGILRQRSSAPHSHPPTITSSTLASHSQPSHQVETPIAPKKMVTAVVMPSSSSSSFVSFSPTPSSSRVIAEAQAVAAAKASVVGKRRQCSCKNSQCLKLYCDCFSHEEFCSADCSCRNCRNNLAYSETRELTMKMYKGRDPTAFHHPQEGVPGQRARGCRCKKTLCVKKYCECFHAGVLCSALCRCINCKNRAPPTTDLLPHTHSPSMPHPHTISPSMPHPHTISLPQTTASNSDLHWTAQTPPTGSWPSYQPPHACSTAHTVPSMPHASHATETETQATETQDTCSPHTDQLCCTSQLGYEHDAGSQPPTDSVAQLLNFSHRASQI